MLSRIGALWALLLCAVLPSTAQSVVANVTVPGTPAGVAVNPGNNRIYVGLVNSGKYSVSVINGATNTVIDNVPLSYGSLVDAVNITTGRVYVAGCTYTEATVICGVSVLDGATDKVLATIPINASNGIGLEGIAVNPVTNRVYVADGSNLEVDVIDGNSNAMIANISMGGQQPLGLAVDFGTNQVVATINGDQIAVIDGRTNTILRRIMVGSENANVAVNSFTSMAYVTNETFSESTVGVVNLKSPKVVTNVSTGDNPFGVAVDIFSNLIFVTNLGDQTVAVIDGRTNAKIGSVSADSDAIDVNPVTRLVYTSDPTDGLVHVISE